MKHATRRAVPEEKQTSRKLEQNPQNETKTFYEKKVGLLVLDSASMY